MHSSHWTSQQTQDRSLYLSQPDRKNAYGQRTRVKALPPRKGCDTGQHQGKQIQEAGFQTMVALSPLWSHRKGVWGKQQVNINVDDKITHREEKNQQRRKCFKKSNNSAAKFK